MRMTTVLCASFHVTVPVERRRWPLSLRRPAKVCVWLSTTA